MSISYYLRENHLADDPKAFRAFVSPARTVELKDVIERMVEKGSTVGYADILGVFALFSTVLETMLSEGANVNTPFANYRTSIKGNFVNPQDIFDHSRHKIVPSVSAGKRLKDFFLNYISTTKITAVNRNPNPIQLTDIASGQINTIVTPGNMVSLVGNRLKMEPENINHGIFFIAEDGIETRVGYVGRNMPTELVFLVPNALQSGAYTLELRTYSNGKLNAVLNVP